MRIGAADPVVANLGAEHAVLDGDADFRARRLRVLDRVGEGLRHDEVRTRLDLRGEPLMRDVHVDGHVEAGRDRAERGVQAAAGEGDGVHPVCQLADVLVSLLDRLERLADE